MEDKRPAYDVASPEKYITANGEEKTRYTNVGSAWKIKNGGIAIRLRPNLAVSNELLLFVPTPKPGKQDDAPDEDGYGDDNGIPL